MHISLHHLPNWEATNVISFDHADTRHFADSFPWCSQHLQKLKRKDGASQSEPATPGSTAKDKKRNAAAAAIGEDDGETATPCKSKRTKGKKVVSRAKAVDDEDDDESKPIKDVKKEVV